MSTVALAVDKHKFRLNLRNRRVTEEVQHDVLLIQYPASSVEPPAFGEVPTSFLVPELSSLPPFLFNTVTNQ